MFKSVITILIFIIPVIVYSQDSDTMKNKSISQVVNHVSNRALGVQYVPNYPEEIVIRKRDSTSCPRIASGAFYLTYIIDNKYTLYALGCLYDSIERVDSVLNPNAMSTLYLKTKENTTYNLISLKSLNNKYIKADNDSVLYMIDDYFLYDNPETYLINEYCIYSLEIYESHEINRHCSASNNYTIINILVKNDRNNVSNQKKKAEVKQEYPENMLIVKYDSTYISHIRYTNMYLIDNKYPVYDLVCLKYSIKNKINGYNDKYPKATIFIETKDTSLYNYISLDSLNNKYVKANKETALYMIEDKFVFDNPDTYLINEKCIYSIEIYNSHDINRHCSPTNRLTIINILIYNSRNNKDYRSEAIWKEKFR